MCVLLCHGVTSEAHLDLRVCGNQFIELTLCNVSDGLLGGHAAEGIERWFRVNMGLHHEIGTQPSVRKQHALFSRALNVRVLARPSPLSLDSLNRLLDDALHIDVLLLLLALVKHLLILS